MIYISILRGINVSGQRKIKMANLKDVYVSLGFQNVITYIQSGNVIFKSNEEDTKKVAAEIEAAILKSFGFDVPVLVIELARLTRVYTSNPFVNERHEDEAFLHVTFLEENTDVHLLNKITTDPKSTDEFVISGSAIYLYCPNGYGRTKLNNNFFENKLKAKATTRNWKTITNLVELASKINS